MPELCLPPPGIMILPSIATVGAVLLAAFVRRSTPGRWLLTRFLVCVGRLRKTRDAALGSFVRIVDDTRAAAAGPSQSEEDGCLFVEAMVYTHNTDAPRSCATFEAVRRNAQLGHRVLLMYRRVGDERRRVYRATYNPLRPAHNKPHPVRCPPHHDDWDRMSGDGGGTILSATLNAHRADGKTRMYDVTEALQQARGPLGDFHGRAGATMTAYTLVPDLEGDVVAASLLYYAENGAEFAHDLPNDPTTALPDGADGGALEADAPISCDISRGSAPSAPHRRLVGAADGVVRRGDLDIQIAVASPPSSQALVRSLQLRRRRLSSKGKTCDLQ